MNPTPSPLRTVRFPDGTRQHALGLGTWQYGEDPSRRAAEVAAIREALEIGYRVFDTAEMYAEGGAESILGEALRGALRERVARREEVFVVSKVYPHNAGGDSLRRSCAASLKRLRLDRIDLYLLHWRGSVPLAETLTGFQALEEQGHIARWGVSNFDVPDLCELTALAGGGACMANQVYLSLSERGPEFELLPWQRERSIPLMAYSPFDQGALVRRPALAAVASRYGATPAQIALAALLAEPGVMAIPKTSNPARLRENWAAAKLSLADRDLAELDQAFPRPRHKQPLAMR